MGLLDYIPVVSTIKHAFFDDPPGRSVADYADCATTVADCESLGTDLAVMNCQRCGDKKGIDFLLDLVGGSFVPDAFKAVVGGATGLLALRIIASVGVRAASRGVLVATGVGILLLGDAVIDAGITIKRVGEIRDAAAQAEASLCRCPPS